MQCDLRSCPAQSVNMKVEQRAHECLPHTSLSTGPIRKVSYMKTYPWPLTEIAQKAHCTVHLVPEAGTHKGNMVLPLTLHTLHKMHHQRLGAVLCGI